MYHKRLLPNGITLITVPVKGTRATTVLAMFPVGSRYETKKISGISHFVEHMMFKGTARRPSAPDISRALERVGADYNAFTFKDYTGYYVKISGNNQSLAFDLLADMIYRSKIEAAEVEKEKGAIVEELRMYQDNPTMEIDLLADRVVFGDRPLGWDIGGSAETVRAISRSELWNFYREHYSPQNMVLTVAGQINPKKMSAFLAHFAEEPKLPHSHTPAFYQKQYEKFSWPSAAAPLAERVLVKEKPVDQAQVIISFPGTHHNDPDRNALSILLNILGTGMSSRLFVEVREKRGLAYMVRTGATSYRDVGVCYIQAGLDPARLSEALAVIRAEVEKIVREQVTSEELDKAKNNTAGHLALSLEDSSAQADWFAKQSLFYRRIKTPDQILQELKKIKAADVQRAARRLLDWKEMRLALIGPVTKEKVLAMVK